MQRSNVTTDKYKLSDRLTITVKNTPAGDEDGQTWYKAEITLKYKKFLLDEPLSFKSCQRPRDPERRRPSS